MKSWRILFSNLFFRAKEDPDLFDDVKEAVVEECSQFGKVEEIYLDEYSPDGLVYLQLDTLKAAEETKKLLDGRYYAGKKISASYISSTVFNNKRPR